MRTALGPMRTTTVSRVIVFADHETRLEIDMQSSSKAWNIRCVGGITHCVNRPTETTAMSDVIFSIAIFHSLCALSLILGSAFSALRRRSRHEVILQSAPSPRADSQPSTKVVMPGATPHAA